MNTLFSDIDIYSGNIMLFTNQFLSPISNSAPTFYEFFLGDTITIKLAKKLVRLAFISAQSKRHFCSGNVICCVGWEGMHPG